MHRRRNIDVSITIPTFREVENLPLLLDRLESTFSGSPLSVEVIIVDDDSQDGTDAFCAAHRSTIPLRLITRKHERGLSSAVIAGMEQSEGTFLCVMDADLSHPPEQIPTMIDRLKQGSTEMVIGSRYVEGGSTTDDWGFLRWINSKAATLAARPFTKAADPMAGFFALRRNDFLRSKSLLDPIGYKIGLELIVKADLDDVAEVPIRFTNRVHGDSKLTLKEQLNYVRHIGRLCQHRFPGTSQAATFLGIGLTGILVDVISFVSLTSVTGPPVARATAILLAMHWNYLLHRRISFSCDQESEWRTSYPLFVMSCGTGLLVNWVSSLGIISLFSGVPLIPVFAALAGAILGSISNFLLLQQLVFDQPSVASASTLQLYDPENLAERIDETVQSTASLQSDSLPDQRKVA